VADRDYNYGRERYSRGRYGNETEERGERSYGDRYTGGQYDYEGWESEPYSRLAGYGGRYSDEMSDREYGARDYARGGYERDYGTAYGKGYGGATYGYGGGGYGRERMGERRGQYAGRGPKGYQRSDERIHEDVCERLTNHPNIDASEIEVSVDDRTVTLSGTVNSRSEKRMAEDVAESISGVKDVRCNIHVAQGGQQTQGRQGARGQGRQTQGQQGGQVFRYSGGKM
jgi:osmotically-inducible protein OsmY